MTGTKRHKGKGREKPPTSGRQPRTFEAEGIENVRSLREKLYIAQAHLLKLAPLRQQLQECHSIQLQKSLDYETRIKALQVQLLIRNFVQCNTELASS